MKTVMKTNPHQILTPLILCCATVLLSACLPEKNLKPEVPAAKVDTAKTQQAAIKQELAGLLKQSRIDPISDFIKAHDKQAAYHDSLTQLRKVREQRCGDIATLYDRREKSKEMLAQLKGGYQYSCPHIVIAFAQDIKVDALADKTAPVVKSSQQAHDIAACDQAYDKLDYKTAMSYCKKLALRGHPESQLKLGVMYVDGRGIDKDYQAAYVWFTLAVQAGIKQATVLRDSIARSLSKKELVSAHDKAAKIANAY